MQIIPVILKALEFLQDFQVKIMKKKKKFQAAMYSNRQGWMQKMWNWQNKVKVVSTCIERFPLHLGEAFK